MYTTIYGRPNMGIVVREFASKKTLLDYLQECHDEIAAVRQDRPEVMLEFLTIEQPSESHIENVIGTGKGNFTWPVGKMLISGPHGYVVPKSRTVATQHIL